MTTHAHYSIYHQLLELAHLTIGKRQRHIKGVLLVIHHGCGLVQLGRHLYPLAANQALFLPADTLFAWHHFAGARVSWIEFSLRLTQGSQVGLVPDSELLTAAARRLAEHPEENDWHGPQGRLCRILYDELQRQSLTPLRHLYPTAQHLLSTPDPTQLSAAQAKTFAAQFGISASDFCAQYQLLRARQDLARGQLSEQQLAQHGFSSFAQFEHACDYWQRT